MGLRSNAEAADAKAAGKPSPDAAPGNWEPPIPLDESAEAIPAFPLHLLPATVRQFVEAVAESVYCPLDYPAVACLATASAAIGASYVVEVKADFRQGAGLYCAIVGDPSVKKSPPIKHVIRPLLHEQAERVASILEKDGHLPAVWPHGEGELVVSDTTVERLAELLQRQARGLLLYRPELVGWLLSLNQYKAKGVGGDRSFFLEVYDSEPITIHRKNQGTGVVYVARPSLTMLGATQPDVVQEFFERRDGLAERILWTYPIQPPARGERFFETPGALSARWGATVKNLLKIPMASATGEKRPHPRVMRLAPSARDAWQAYTDRLAAEQNDPDFPARLKPAYGKLEGAAARIAIVLQLLDTASKDGDGEDTLQPEWVEAAGEVAFYFGAHARRVRRACSDDPRLDGARRILAWAVDGNHARFTRADLWRSLRRNTLFDRPESLTGPLKLLETHKLIRWAPAAEHAAGPPTPAGFEVNPAVRKQTNQAESGPNGLNGRG